MRVRAHLISLLVTTSALALAGCAADDTPRTVGKTAPIAPATPGGTSVPPVLGRDIRDARALIAHAGLRVNEVQQLDCGLIERVTEAAPVPGTPVAPDSTITLTYSEAPPNASCAYTPEAMAWDFLDWAAGRGSSSLRFARQLGAPQAPPPAWKHAGDIARVAVSLVPTGDGTSAQPTLNARYATCPPSADCIAEGPWLKATLELRRLPCAAGPDRRDA